MEKPLDKTTACLQAAWTYFKSHNPQLSLRATAKRLDLSPSYLSKILRGEKRLPEHLVSSLGQALQMDDAGIQKLQRAVLEDFETSKLVPQTGVSALNQTITDLDLETYHALGKSDFWLLDEWYNLPLLNLITTDDFVSDPAWIARRLGISELHVRQAIENFTRAGYLEVSEGRLQRTQTKLRFPTNKTHRAIRDHHRAMLTKASQKLSVEISEDEFSERLITGVSFAGSLRAIKEAQTILNQAMYKVAEIMSEEPCDEVFQVSVQLFKISQRD